jgi:hypothetical protein
MNVVGLEYNPATKRVAWWSGRGTCAGELASPAMISMASADSLSWRSDRSGMACGGALEGLATDEAYVYFSQGGWLWRLALGASVNQAPTQLPLGVSQGFTPTAVARWGDDLFWVESNGTFSKLWKAAGGGTGQQELVQTGLWGNVRKMRLFYDTASFHFPLSCLLLSENGQLWKGVLTPPSPLTPLASGISDFDFRIEGGGGGEIQVLPFCRVFAIQGAQLKGPGRRRGR